MPQMITPYGLRNNQQGTREPSEWEKMLQQARLAMTLDGETALGLALGKGLRYLWDKHIAARHAKQNAENLAKRQAGENMKNGTWTDEDVAKYHGLGDDFIANLDRNDPNGNVVAEAVGVVPIVDNAGNRVQPAPQRNIPTDFSPVTNTTGQYIDGTGTLRDILTPTEEYYNLLNRRWR